MDVLSCIPLSPFRRKYTINVVPKYKPFNLYMSNIDPAEVDKERKKKEFLNNFSMYLKKFRLTAYASEVGESLRPIIPRSWVRALYGVSWGYVFLDTGFNTHMALELGRETAAWTCLDKSIWHCLASMAFPAYTIHTIVKYSGRLLRFFFKNRRIARFGPTAIGLSCIPFIVHPLDHFTDYMMDRSLRLLYGHKLPENIH